MSTILDKNFVYALCRRGDLGQYKDREIIACIDPNEQVNGFKLSEEAQKIFIILKLQKTKKGTIVSNIANNANENNTKKYLIKKTLLPSHLYSPDGKTATKTVCPIIDASDSDIDFTNSFTNVKDVNAYVGGPTTVGSSGTYPTYAALKADFGTITSNGTITQISDLTETTSTNLTFNVGARTLLFNGAGFQTTSNGGFSLFDIRVTSSSGTLKFTNHRFLQSTFVTAAQAFIQIVNGTGAVTVEVADCQFKGNPTYRYYGIRAWDADCTLKAYRNVFVDFYTEAGIATDICAPDSLVENCTFDGCEKGIDLKGVTGGTSTLTVRNCVAIRSVETLGGFYNQGIATLEKCASDDGSGSEVSLRYLVPANIFKSLTYGDPNYLVPKETGSLFGRGATSALSDTKTFFNNSVAGKAASYATPARSKLVLPIMVGLFADICKSQGFIVGEGNVTTVVSAQANAGQKVILTADTTGRVANQLLTYIGASGRHYTAAIDSVDPNVSITLKTNIEENIAAGNNVVSFYRNNSHPTDPGYRAIADHFYYNYGTTRNLGIHSWGGDSWTFEDVIITRLETLMTGATIINEGVSGNTSAQLLARYDADILPNNSKYVMVLIGTNDWYGSVVVRDYLANIRSIVQKIRDDGAEPVLFTSSVGISGDPKFTLSQSYNDAVLAEYTNRTEYFIGANGLSPASSVRGGRSLNIGIGIGI